MKTLPIPVTFISCAKIASLIRRIAVRVIKLANFGNLMFSPITKNFDTVFFPELINLSLQSSFLLLVDPL